ncbi:hypothetical protein D3C76_1498120 [compost metagenome]
MTARRRIFRFLYFAENSPTVFEIPLTRLTQIHTACGACQQRGADAFLQGCHRPGNARRRQTQTPRCRGKTLRLGDGREDLHFLEAVHGWVLVKDKKGQSQLPVFHRGLQ